MQDANPKEVQQTTKAKAVEYLSLEKGTSSLTGLVKDFLPTMEEGIVFVDQSVQKLVNNMGQGRNLAEGIKKEFAESALEIIKLGGTQEDALNIQKETQDILGRNVVLTADQSKELFGVSQITGVATKELQAGFINVGMSLKDISSEMLKVREVSNNLGVNARAVSDLVVKNLDKLNRFNFQGGVEGLAKMAAQSQTLRVGMEETMDFADGLMDPEKAIEMSATFQRLGVTSEKLLNPLKLMDMAQNDVAGLQKEIAGAVAQYTTFNKETGKSQISPQGIRILKQISAESGIARGSLEKMALAEREIGEKLSVIDFSGFNIDDETKSLIANVATMGEGGEYKVKIKDENNNIIEKSIQELMVATKGNPEEIRKALVGEEEKTPTDPDAIPKRIEELAKSQLDVATSIDKNTEAVSKATGFTVGASKLGEQILLLNKTLNEKLGEPFYKRLKPGEGGEKSPISAAADDLGKQIEETLKKVESGEAGTKELYALLDDATKFKKTAGGEMGTAVLESATNVMGEDNVKALIDAFDEETLKKLSESFGTLPDEIKEKLTEWGIDFDKIINKETKKEEEEVIGFLPEERKAEERGFTSGTFKTESIDTKNINVEVPTSTVETKTQGVTEAVQTNPIEPTITIPKGTEEEVILGNETPLQEEGIIYKTQEEEKILPNETPLQEEGIIYPQTLDTGSLENTLDNLDKSLTDGINTKSITTESLNITTDKPINLVAPEKTEEITTTPITKPTTIQTIKPEIQKLIDEGIVGEPIAGLGNEISLKQPQPITEEELPAIEEGLPPVKTEQRKGLSEIISQISSNLKSEEITSSSYEDYKKVIEEISGGKVVGQGEEAFVLKPEMIEKGKKDAEFIGPETPKTPFQNIQPTKIEPAQIIEPKIEPTGINTSEIKQKPKFERSLYKFSPGEIPEEIEGVEQVPSIGGTLLSKEEGWQDFVKKKVKPIEGEKFELPSDITDEELEALYNVTDYDRKNKPLEARYYQAKQGSLANQIEKAKEEGKSPDEIKKLSAQLDEFEAKQEEVESQKPAAQIEKIAAEKIEEPKTLEVTPTPIVSETPKIPTPKKEEKQPLGQRLKEGIGNLAEKIKKEKVQESSVTAVVPETQEEYIVRDSEGKELARSIDRETAEKKAGTSEGITVYKKTTPITPSVPETPAVGIEKIAAEKAEEPKTLREKIKEGADKLGGGIEKFAGKIGKKFEETKGKEELPKTEPIQSETTKEEMFPVSSKYKGPFYEMKDGKLSLRDPYEILDEMEGKTKVGEELPKTEPIPAKETIKPILEPPKTEPTKNDFTEYLKGKGTEIEGIKKEPQILDYLADENEMNERAKFGAKPLEQIFPEEAKEFEKTKGESVKEATPKKIGEEPIGISLTQMEEEEGGIVEPVTITPEEPKETEIQKVVRESQEKQLSYLEELRQKEQIETPSRGIEKIAEIGGRIGEFGKGLFGKPEVQEETQQYEMPEEAEYEYTPTNEMGKFDISNLKQQYLGPEEIEAPEAPEITIPEIPTPQGINEQVLGNQGTQGATESSQTININAKIEITGNPEFAKLLDPRKLQSTVESIFVSSMSQKTNIAQKVNASSQDASMGISSYSSSLDR